jgi:hypothetical protein
MNLMQGLFYILLAARISNESSSPSRDTLSTTSKENATLEESGSTTGVHSLAMDDDALMMPVDATCESSGVSPDLTDDAE